MLHGELGRYPIAVFVKTRMIGYWNRLLVGKPSKYSYLLYKHTMSTGIPLKWNSYIRNILIDVGRHDIWLNQSNITSKHLNILVKQTLKDQYIQTWNSAMTNSCKGTIYRSFKTALTFEKYITVLPRNLAFTLLKFRTSNTKFPIETGRWDNTLLEDRKCTLCDLNEVGSEEHYLLICPHFTVLRQRYIPRTLLSQPIDDAFARLMTVDSQPDLLNLSKFIGMLLKAFRT